MRRVYLVCYDISDAKRLRKVNKILKGYGEFWQYSVYFCVLGAAARASMQRELESAINHLDDRLLVMDLGRNEDAIRGSVVAIGQSVEQPLYGARVF